MTKSAKKTDVDVWMPLYIGDYLADTSRLSTEQHGAYFLLIMDYWRNGAPPDDDVILAQITKATGAGWRKLRSAMLMFFEVVDGKWMHSRIEEELAKAKERAEKAQAKARKAADARWSTEAVPEQQAEQCIEDAPSNATSIPQAMHKECPSPSPSPPLLPKERSKTLSGRPDALAILAYLNERTGRNYQPVDSNTKLIVGRLREGATVEQCKAVIDAKVAKWGADARMDEFLRPKTLFGATNFAQYAGELGVTKPAASNDPEGWRKDPKFAGGK
ncbi:conserved phage C-terminal domain-containing protein [Herbaspirillum sp. GCM10030257]|uniref:conserved phage C-terminal domain-containing protein n=1 Tax=Herbaspirillum sp. GCM10030257 TaxID=3273393 RepID=UPI0036219A4D